MAGYLLARCASEGGEAGVAGKLERHRREPSLLKAD